VVARNWQRLPWEIWYQHGAMAMSRLRRAQVELTHRHCTVRFDGPAYLGPGFSLSIPECGTFEVGRGVVFRRGFHCEIGGTGRVSIGAGTDFTNTCLIQCSTTITIGERCGIGQATSFVDGSHNFRDHTRHWAEQGYSFRPISIGDGVAITAKCTIFASVGDHSFIGANSVVTKDIPAYCVAVGAPARVVEYFGPPELQPVDLEL
jgi:acetyltransferase-like isoleucine patch superfamily enzyme